MKTVDIIRAWKNPEYRESLSPEELALLPENPAGEVELSDEDLASVAIVGGNSICDILTVCQSVVGCSIVCSIAC